jgi:hypothetical protein
MNVEDFALACTRLTSEGFEVRKAQYDERAFGSWFIELSAGKRGVVRLTWDGKDSSLVLQAHHDGAWEDLWIAGDRVDQSLDRAVSEMHAVL